jgi:hypothetical protein
VAVAVIEVLIALVTANGVPVTAVKVSKLKYFEYTKSLRELFAPALITDENLTVVSVINVAVSEIMTGIAELTRTSITFPRVFPDSLVASKRR